MKAHKRTDRAKKLEVYLRHGVEIQELAILRAWCVTRTSDEGLDVVEERIDYLEREIAKRADDLSEKFGEFFERTINQFLNPPSFSQEK